MGGHKVHQEMERLVREADVATNRKIEAAVFP